MVMPSGPGEGLERLLRSLPREEAPDPGIDAIFERWQRQRRRALAGAGLAAAALLGLGLLLWNPAEVEPPVHLDVRFVDVEDATVEEAWVDPEEGRGP